MGKALFPAIYIVRCACSASLSYWLALMIGLPFPVWASMSGVIVSQAKLNETRASLLWRIVGTLVGIVVSLIVDAAIGSFVGTGWQILISVGICAAIATRYPLLRVSMWTAPIVLLTAGPSVAVHSAGLYRGAEVILGCLVGGAFHLLAERLIWAIGLPAGAHPASPLQRGMDDD
ncbi:MAG: FUSC family protein [Burkholderiaceae bacterium]|nr:FUSC family protein [Burkholderiaceae bacterium]